MVVLAHGLVVGHRERQNQQKLIKLSFVQDGSLHLTFDFSQYVSV
jgi:hypothetical protein